MRATWMNLSQKAMARPLSKSLRMLFDESITWVGCCADESAGLGFGNSALMKLKVWRRLKSEAPSVMKQLQQKKKMDSIAHIPHAYVYSTRSKRFRWLCVMMLTLTGTLTVLVSVRDDDDIPWTGPKLTPHFPRCGVSRLAASVGGGDYSSAAQSTYTHW
jgi:hypothetical protein